MTGETPGVATSARAPADAAVAAAAGRAPHADRMAQDALLLALTALPAQDPATYAHAMAQTITRALDVDWTAVLRCTPDEGTLISLGAGGTPLAGVSDDLECLPLREPSPLAAVVRTGTPYLTRDVRDDDSMPPSFGRAGVRALVAVPLLIDGSRAGLVYLASRRVGVFSQEDHVLLTLVAARVGLLIEQAELTQRRAELEREHARQQARQEFLGIVSHELKTPVAVIKAYTEALLHRATRDGDAEGVRILHRVEDQAARMLSLIDDVLDLQRLEAGPMALETSRVDLVELAAHVVEGLALTTDTHPMTVQADAATFVRADRRRIEQVLTNVLQNAVKYSPGGGAITVVIQRVPRPDEGALQALLAVSDHGVGIAPADLPYVFNRFYQAAGGWLHNGVRGLGVGLYIAREIVERHGGTMWVESAENDGATFYLTLPLA